MNLKSFFVKTRLKPVNPKRLSLKKPKPQYAFHENPIITFSENQNMNFLFYFHENSNMTSIAFYGFRARSQDIFERWLRDDDEIVRKQRRRPHFLNLPVSNPISDSLNFRPSRAARAAFPARTQDRPAGRSKRRRRRRIRPAGIRWHHSSRRSP